MVDSLAEDSVDVDFGMLRDAMQPLRDHRAFIVVFVLSAMLSALALTYMYSERYRGEATILFKPAETTNLMQHSTQALGSPFPTNTAYKAVDQTITQMLDTDALLRRVVADLHLDVAKPKDLSGPWYIQYYKQAKYVLEDYAASTWQILQFGRTIDDPVDGAIGMLRRNLKISSTDSYVYSLKIVSTTAELAKAIANDLAARLIDTFRGADLDSTGEKRERIAKLRDEKSREVENLEEQLRDLQAGNLVASISDELTEATRRTSHFQSEQADTTADLHESDAKLAELTARVRTASSEAAQHTGPDASAISQASRLSPNDYTRLTSDRLDAQVRSRGLSAKLASIDRTNAAANARLQVLAQVQAQSDFLSARLTAAKRDFATLSETYLEATIESATGQGELQLQAEATSPPVPISPIKIYHVGAAGALALMIAIGPRLCVRLFRHPTVLADVRGRRNGAATSDFSRSCAGDGERSCARYPRLSTDTGTPDNRDAIAAKVAAPLRRRPRTPLWFRLIVAVVFAVAVAVGASYALRKMNL